MSWEQYQFFYTDHFEVHLEAAHRFPMRKYRDLRHQLVEHHILDKDQLKAARALDHSYLELAHSKDYIEQVINLTLPVREARKIGLPLSRDMVNRALVSQGAFWDAVTSSEELGFSASLAGGTHHAHYDAGEGFCFFNDFAINARRVQFDNPKNKILIIDLDVHQGNGNNSILCHDERVFIMSYHGKHNYPYRKVPSSLDREFENDADDEIYLSTLKKDLDKLKSMSFSHLFYQAGVDALKADSFGKLSLTLNGLRQRDELIFEFMKEKNLKMTMALGGGYAKNIQDSINAYLQTYEVAKEYLSR